MLCGITDGILKSRVHAGHVYHGPHMDTAQRCIRNTNRRVPDSWIQLYRGSVADLENRKPNATPCHSSGKERYMGSSYGDRCNLCRNSFCQHTHFDKWFSLPEIFYLAPLPILSGALVAFVWWQLSRLPLQNDRWSWTPFAAEIALFSLTYGGMVHSFYPYIVPKKITIHDAASAPESLFIILIGTLFLLPSIVWIYDAVILHLPPQSDGTALRLSNGSTPHGG